MGTACAGRLGVWGKELLELEREGEAGAGETGACGDGAWEVAKTWQALVVMGSQGVG